MIYVASFVNEYDYDVDCRRDNLGEDTMADLAHGFTCCAGSDHDRVLEKAKLMFRREYAEYQVDEETAEAIELAEMMLEADLEFIEEAPAGVQYRVELLGEVIGAIIIRGFEEV